MLRKLKWVFYIVLALIAFAFFHYNLPQVDVVRVVGTSVKRMDLSAENRWAFSAPESGSSTASSDSRDVLFIDTITPSGRPSVFRNEDTAWGWPPYFKFNSFDVQATASNLTSTAEAPKWVAVTHYGWRIQFLTVFPNAIKLREVSGPDVSFFPWLNTIILSALALLLFLIRRMWLQFRERTIDPAMVEAGEAWDAVDARADKARDNAKGVFGRIGAWFGTWRKPKR